MYLCTFRLIAKLYQLKSVCAESNEHRAKVCVRVFFCLNSVSHVIVCVCAFGFDFSEKGIQIGSVVGEARGDGAMLETEEVM